MPIYITPKDAEHEEKLPEKAAVQTATPQKTYTQEEVQKMLEQIQKGNDVNGTTNQSEN